MHGYETVPTTSAGFLFGEGHNKEIRADRRDVSICTSNDDVDQTSRTRGEVRWSNFICNYTFFDKNSSVKVNDAFKYLNDNSYLDFKY